MSSHNTDARQTIERLTLSSYSACVNTENLVIKPGSAQIDVNFVNLKFVYIRVILKSFNVGLKGGVPGGGWGAPTVLSVSSDSVIVTTNTNNPC